MSAGVAPVALIGGWTLAVARQPPGYDSTRDTISALAARGAHDAWIMTTALAVLGVCHLVTAAGLTDVGRPARVVLGAGGLATVLVAAAPQPNAAHVPAATVGFIALTAWPALSTLPPSRVGIAAALALLGLLTWFAFALGTTTVGLSERALAGAQAICPLAFAAILLARQRRAQAARR